jgi:hypothetical protein
MNKATSKDKRAPLQDIVRDERSRKQTVTFLSPQRSCEPLNPLKARRFF